MKASKILLLLLVQVCFGFASCDNDETHGYGDVGSVHIGNSNLSLSVGESFDLRPSFNSRNTESKTFVWSTDDDKIVSVTTNDDKSGTIKAVAEGTTIVRMQSLDKAISAVCTIAVNNEKIIRILAIGNSFSEDAIENYLYDLAKAEGKKVIIGNMYIGGCSLETHWQNASNNYSAYEYRKIGKDGLFKNERNMSISAVLANENWDYISFQEVSQLSGIRANYDASLPQLVEYVQSLSTNPSVKYILHQTWAYAKNSDHSGFANYDKDQLKMYNAIIDATSYAANSVGIDIVVPSGTAIQNGRTSVIGDNFCKDGYHLDLNIGRYTAACTWFEKIFGINVIGNSFKPTALSAYDAQIAQNAAHFAVLKPKEVTVLENFKDEEPNNDVLERPIYLDFGLIQSGTPWNNMTSHKSGRIVGLFDEKGTNTKINIELTKPFESDNDLGVENTTLDLAREVSKDAFWSSNAYKEGQFTVSHMNKSKAYSFSFYGSRKDVSDNRETAYKVKGLSEETVYLNASSNASNQVTVSNMKPDSEGKITITVLAGPNNNNGSKYYYINSMIIAPGK